MASNFENNNNIAHFVGQKKKKCHWTYPHRHTSQSGNDKINECRSFSRLRETHQFCKKTNIFFFFSLVSLVFISTKALRLCYQAQGVWVFIKVYKKNHISHPVVTFFFFVFCVAWKVTFFVQNHTQKLASIK